MKAVFYVNIGSEEFQQAIAQILQAKVGDALEKEVVIHEVTLCFDTSDCETARDDGHSTSFDQETRYGSVRVACSLAMPGLIPSNGELLGNVTQAFDALRMVGQEINMKFKSPFPTPDSPTIHQSGKPQKSE